MADSIVSTGINIDAQQATLTVGNLRNEISELQLAAIKAGEQGNKTLVEQYYTQANKARQSITGLNLSMVALGNSSGKVGGLIDFGHTVSTGFDAATHSATLFATAGDEASKKVQQVEAGLKLLESVKSFAEGVKSINGFITSLKGVQEGLGGVRTAMVSTGIGALIVAVGMLAANWDDVSKAVGKFIGIEDESNKVREVDNQISEKAIGDYADLEMKARALAKQATDVNVKYSERINALNELHKIDSVHFKDAKDIKDIYKETTQSLEDYIEQIKNQAIEQAIVSRQAELEKEKLKLSTVSKDGTLLGIGDAVLATISSWKMAFDFVKGYYMTLVDIVTLRFKHIKDEWKDYQADLNKAGTEKKNEELDNIAKEQKILDDKLKLLQESKKGNVKANNGGQGEAYSKETELMERELAKQEEGTKEYYDLKVKLLDQNIKNEDTAAGRANGNYKRALSERLAFDKEYAKSKDDKIKDDIDKAQKLEKQISDFKKTDTDKRKDDIEAQFQVNAAIDAESAATLRSLQLNQLATTTRIENEKKLKDTIIDRINATGKANDQEAVNLKKLLIDGTIKQAEYDKLMSKREQENLKAQEHALQSGLTTMTAYLVKNNGIVSADFVKSFKDLQAQLGKIQNDIVLKESETSRLVKEEKQKEKEDKLKTAQEYSNGIMSLSEAVFTMELAHAGNNQKEKEKILKKQFEVNKAFQVADATINYLKGLVAIQSTPENASSLGITGIAETAILSATYAASLAKILTAQFSGGASSSAVSTGGSSAGAGVSITSVNSTLLRSQQQQAQTLSGAMNKMKVYVVESDITKAQTKVNDIKTRATF